MTDKTPLSILDLVWISGNTDVAGALAQSRELAQHGESLGFNRYWVAEHHNNAGVASCATSIVMANIAAATQKIRLGSGGIMLPNHSPLVIAEQFGTLAALHPGRIDLGLGRAPGTDGWTVRALRRNLQAASDSFPDDVLELQSYFQPAKEGQRVVAVPAEGQDVPIWILGSSTYGAQLAAALGMPYSFASHFAPGDLHDALHVYRSTYQPSARFPKPYVMLGMHVFAADTAEEANLHASSLQQIIYHRQRGVRGKLLPPDAGFFASCSAADQHEIRSSMRYAAIGTGEQVAAQMRQFIADTQADELMIAAPFYHHAARLRSYQLIAEHWAAS
jgi:luciferase family oxidoreductase group 1